MNKRDFKQTEELLRQAGLPATEARYDAEVFGSWHITLGTPTPLRIVWDGRDQCLFVYAEVGASAFSRTDWQQVWAAYSAPERTPEHVVREVVCARG
jgi:hypothetical protein